MIFFTFQIVVDKFTIVYYSQLVHILINERQPLINAQFHFRISRIIRKINYNAVCDYIAKLFHKLRRRLQNYFLHSILIEIFYQAHSRKYVEAKYHP